MHLVGLYTYCRMMHGAHNVKKKFIHLNFTESFTNCLNVSLLQRRMNLVQAEYRMTVFAETASGDLTPHAT